VCCLRSHVTAPSACNTFLQSLGIGEWTAPLWTASQWLRRSLISHFERPQPQHLGGRRLDRPVVTTDDCRTVLQMIASSPHAAVPASQLEAHLGFGLFGWGGAQKLQSLNNLS
jgi:hypothetical protein